MSSNLDKFFKTNKMLETDGIWFDVSNETGFKMKRFGGYNSPAVKALMNKYYKPYAKMIENDSLPKDKQDEIMAKVFVESSMIDWKGVEVEGKEIPFTVEAAVKLLVGLPELNDTLFKYASDFNNFREDLGN